MRQNCIWPTSSTLRLAVKRLSSHKMRNLLRLGTLTVAVPIEVLMTQQLIQNDIALLPITVAPLIVVSTVPLHHRDPFDRLLIAQAMVEQRPIVSADPAFDA